MASNMERQAKFKRQQVGKGLKQVNVWLPIENVAEVRLALAVCASEPGRYRIVTIQDTQTGKMLSLRRMVAAAERR